MVKNKHLSDTERKTIENLLNEGYNLTLISYTISRSISTISREIEKHKQIIFPSCFNKSNPCLKYDNCTNRFFDCFKTCIKAEFKKCEKLNPAPHICNACETQKYCRCVRYYYKAENAIKEYKEVLSETRKGLHYTEYELEILNTDLVNLIFTTKSVYHSVIVINKRGFNFKESTIYDQIEKGLINISSSDLPRNNRTKKNKKEPNKDYKRNLEGLTYEDYNIYKDNHPDAVETQMDTVVGIIGADQKVILTLEIVEIKFLIAFIIDHNNQEEVINKLNEFKNVITQEVYDKIVEILLTDNGSEFLDSNKFTELSKNCHIFYCHPNSSNEKGSIENVHEFIRRVIPKGVSLNVYNQDDINKICNNANSLYKKSLDGKCPFDLVDKYIPLNKLKILGFKRIDEDKINLTPYLLGDKNIKNILKYLNKDMIKKANITIK